MPEQPSLLDQPAWPTLLGQPVSPAHRVYPIDGTYHVLWANLTRPRPRSRIHEVYGAQLRCGITVSDDEYRTHWHRRQKPAHEVHGQLMPCPRCFPTEGA